MLIATCRIDEVHNVIVLGIKWFKELYEPGLFGRNAQVSQK